MNNNNFISNNIKNRRSKFKIPKKVKGVNSKIILIIIALLGIGLIVGIYFLYKSLSKKLFSNNPMWISKPVDAFKITDDMKKGYVVPPTANPLNFSYSTWIYISDWNYNYTKSKIIFSRTGKNNKTHEPSLLLSNNQNIIIVLLFII